MTEVVGIKFKKVGKTYYFAPDQLTLKLGDQVIVKTARGIEMGEVVMEPKMVEDNAVVAPLKKVLRLATEKDVETAEKNRAREKETMAVCEKVIAEQLNNIPKEKVRQIAEKYIEEIKNNGKRDFRF